MTRPISALRTSVPKTMDVLLFFALNPDEELSFNDAAVKFDLRAENFGGTIRAWVNAGMLVVRREQVRGSRYRKIVAAGPELLARIGHAPKGR